MLTAMSGFSPPKITSTSAAKGFSATNIFMAEKFTAMVKSGSFAAAVENVWSSNAN